MSRTTRGPSDSPIVPPAALPAGLAPLTPAALQQRLRSAMFGHRIHYYTSIGSTNERALELCASGEPEGSVVLAEEQTRGRGQRRRDWSSKPYLGVYVSLILRPGVATSRAPQFTLLAAVSAADALRAAGIAARIKWPNDIVLDGRKIAGILGEVRGADPEIGELVVGIGINVNHTGGDFPPELRQHATSLRIARGHSADRVELLAALLEGFERRYARLLKDGPDRLLREWESLSSIEVGREITLRGPSGRLTGRFSGVDPEGALLLTAPDGSVHRAPFGAADATVPQ